MEKTNKYNHVDQLNLYLVIKALKSSVVENPIYQNDLEQAIKASEKFRRIDEFSIQPLEEWENISSSKLKIAEKMYLLQYVKCRKEASSLEKFENIDLENPENKILFLEPVYLDQEKQKVKTYKVG